MELIVGPAIALIGSLFFTVASGKKTDERVRELEDKIEKLDGKIVGTDKHLSLKFASTLAPVATAVQKLNQTVGI